MAKYNYQGKSLDGTKCKGTMDATSKAEVYSKLKKLDVHAYRITRVGKLVPSNYRIKANDLAYFCRQVGTMLTAGVPISRVLSIMMERDTSPKLKLIYEQMYTDIGKGLSLSDAMTACKGSFPELLINMVRSGEQSGKIDTTTLKMAEYYEAEHRVNIKIKSAMTYPIILIVVTGGGTLGLFTLVLPKFFDVLIGLDIALPLITVAVLAISEFIINNFLLLSILTVFFCFGMHYFFSMDKVAMWADTMRLRVPKIGKLMQVLYTSRFARTLSSMYSSGVSMLDAVAVSATTVSNRYVESQFPGVISMVREGQALSEAIEQVDGIEAKLTSAIFIGEESGSLDTMLASMASEYEYEARAAIDRMVTYVEPVMIVLMSVIVCTVMLAVYLPILSMTSGLGDMAK